MDDIIKSLEGSPEMIDENSKALKIYLHHNTATQIEVGKLMVAQTHTFKKALELGVDTIYRLANDKEELKVEVSGLKEQINKIGEINEAELSAYKNNNITIDVNKNKIALTEIKRTLELSKSIPYKKTTIPVKK